MAHVIYSKNKYTFDLKKNYKQNTCFCKELVAYSLTLTDT